MGIEVISSGLNMNTYVLLALVAVCVASASASAPGFYGGYGYGPYLSKEAIEARKEAVEAAIAKRKELVAEAIATRKEIIAKRKAAVDALREAQAVVYERTVDLKKTYNPYDYGVGLGVAGLGYGAPYAAPYGYGAPAAEE